MKIKGFFPDLRRFLNVIFARKSAVKSAKEPEIAETINKKAFALHRGLKPLVLLSRREEGSRAYRLTFGLDYVPYFRPGQYVSLRFNYGDSVINRPYSIVSSPRQARDTKSIEIIVRDDPKGFAGHYLCHELNLQETILGEIGLGQFVYEPIRDSSSLVCVAGGVGITPFLSMARDLHEHPESDISLTIIHGSLNSLDAIGDKEIRALDDKRIRLVPVMSEEKGYEGETGFIDEALLRRNVPEGDVTYFLCGPTAMEASVRKALASMGVPARRIRSESYSTYLLAKDPDYPLKEEVKTFSLEVVQGEKVTHVPCNSNEPLIVALERAGFAVHSGCRNGLCGFCRARLLSGNVYVPKEKEARRAMDKEFGYIHTCVTYPLGDVEIKLNIPSR